MRKPRLLKNGASYHVTARANRQENIFEEKSMKKLFLDTLKAAKKKYKFQMYNFCIMDNHIHLMIRPGKMGNLSRILQWVLSVFAVNYNAEYDYHGHVFYDRFHSKIIDDIRHFKTVFDYISDNPVKANMVRKAEDYEYSGLWFIKFKKFEIVEPPSP